MIEVPTHFRLFRGLRSKILFPTLLPSHEYKLLGYFLQSLRDSAPFSPLNPNKTLLPGGPIKTNRCTCGRRVMITPRAFD